MNKIIVAHKTVRYILKCVFYFTNTLLQELKMYDEIIKHYKVKKARQHVLNQFFPNRSI